MSAETKKYGVLVKQENTELIVIDAIDYEDAVKIAEKEVRMHYTGRGDEVYDEGDWELSDIYKLDSDELSYIYKLDSSGSKVF